RLASATALGCLLAMGAVPSLAQTATDDETAADTLPPDFEMSGFGVPDGAEMLLESDTLIYDNDANTVTAAGGVQIDYGGNRLAADRVTYDRNSGRLIAAGNVEILDRQ